MNWKSSKNKISQIDKFPDIYWKMTNLIFLFPTDNKHFLITSRCDNDYELAIDATGRCLPSPCALVWQRISSSQEIFGYFLHPFIVCTPRICSYNGTSCELWRLASVLLLTAPPRSLPSPTTVQLYFLLCSLRIMASARVHLFCPGTQSRDTAIQWFRIHRILSWAKERWNGRLFEIGSVAL